MSNPFYANEISLANEFIKKHSDNEDFIKLLSTLKNTNSMTHAEKWSMIYDYVNTFFPEEKYSSLVTGLTYAIED